MNQHVITGAIGFIKVFDPISVTWKYIGKMRDIRVNENFRRVRVPKGLGSIFADEMALIEWSGTISCSYFEISYGKSGLTDALKRNIFGQSDIFSKIAAGIDTANFEDQAVLDDLGLTVDIYKKVKGTVVAGIINPDALVYAIVSGMFIESDNINIAEANLAGRDQTFSYLRPVVIKE